MGIQGLLPMLKSCMTDTNIRSYSNHTVAIDAYCWLHRGAYVYTNDVVNNNNTTQSIQWCVQRLKLLLQYNITPIVVFDGCQLPNKAHTEQKRKQQRLESQLLGQELLKQGNKTDALKQLCKSIDITPQFARLLIDECIALDIEYIVAPYEADAQLAWLSLNNKVQCVISEDSDLILYGCNRILFKMDTDGYGQELKLKNVFNCITSDINLTAFDLTRLRDMCILSGCDYCPNLPGIGLKKSFQLFQRFCTYDRVIRKLRFDAKCIVPVDYDIQFKRAQLTYLHQRIYNTDTKQLDNLTPLNDETINGLNNDTDFLGPVKSPDIIDKIAQGLVDPDTHETLLLNQRTLQPQNQQRIDTIIQQQVKSTVIHNNSNTQQSIKQTNTTIQTHDTPIATQHIQQVKSKYFLARNTKATQQPYKPPAIIPTKQTTITDKLDQYKNDELLKPYYELQAILPPSKKYTPAYDAYAESKQNQFYNKLCATLGKEQVAKIARRSITTIENISPNTSPDKKRTKRQTKSVQHVTTEKPVKQLKQKRNAGMRVPKFESIFISGEHTVLPSHNSEHRIELLSPPADVFNALIQPITMHT